MAAIAMHDSRPWAAPANRCWMADFVVAGHGSHGICGEASLTSPATPAERQTHRAVDRDRQVYPRRS